MKICQLCLILRTNLFYRAEDGENGRNKNCHGKDGKGCIFKKMPVGVVVRDLKTNKIIADLNEHEKTILVAKAEEAEEEMHGLQTAQKSSAIL